MLLVDATRADLVNCLAQRITVACIGQLEEFAEQILIRVKPKRLFLVASPSSEGHGRGAGLLQRFDGAIRAGVVVLQERSGGNEAESLPDGYLDFIHIDGVAAYSDCIGALRAFAPKVKPGGLISGRGYQAIAGAARDGLVQAVNNFVIESKSNFLALTFEESPTYVLTKDGEAPEAAEFLSSLVRRHLVMAQIVNAEHKVFEQIEVPGTQKKYIFSFD